MIARIIGSSLSVMIIGLGCSSQAFAANTWTIDSAHSSAGFSIKHMMISNVRGTFKNLEGKVTYDGKDIKGIAVDAKIPIKTVNTGEEKRDQHLLQADFFDANKFQFMTFKSKKAVPAGQGKFNLVGDLSLHGKTKEVTLQVDGPSKEIKDPRGNTKIGASATTKIRRQDFGITGSEGMVGDDVNITLDLELTREDKKPEAGKPVKKEG